MAESGFKSTLVALVVFVLFASLITTIAFGMGENYGVVSEDAVGGSLNKTIFTEESSSVLNKSEGYRQRFEDAEVDDIDSIIKDTFSMISSSFKLLGQIMNNVLNFPPLFTSVILGIIVILCLLGIWNILRSGSG